MIAGLSPFDMIATADTGNWLRGVISAVLAAPGDLYNPVYVGPLPSGSRILDAVSAAIADMGLALEEGPHPPAAGVWITGVDEAESALANGIPPRPGVQWVVWSVAASSSVPDRLAGWLGATGLAIDPFTGAAESMGAFPMYPAVQSLLSEHARSGRAVVVVVGDNHDLGTLAAELQLHLEIELEEPVWRGAADGWGLPDRERSTRVLVVTRGTDLEGLCRRLNDLPSGGSPYGLVMDVSTSERLLQMPEWGPVAHRCVWLRRSVQGLPVSEDVFPPVCELLVDSGAAGNPDGIAQFDLTAVSLLEILQSAEGWARSGTLIIFGSNRAGFVELGQGRICAAGVYAPCVPRPRRQERPVFEALRTLSGWRGVAGVFVPGKVGAEGVPIGRVVMALAHSIEAEPSASEVSCLRTHEIAEVLLERGLAEVATAFLRRAEQAASWGPEEDVLFGSISAVQEPEAASARLRHGALRAFSERGAHAGTALYVNGMLNALLVEVRSGQTAAAVAWSILAGWFRDAGSDWVTSARHAAIWMEMALRAGALDPALVAQQRLRELSEEQTRWAGLLSLRLNERGDD